MHHNVFQPFDLRIGGIAPNEVSTWSYFERTSMGGHQSTVGDGVVKCWVSGRGWHRSILRTNGSQFGGRLWNLMNPTVFVCRRMFFPAQPSVLNQRPERIDAEAVQVSSPAAQLAVHSTTQFSQAADGAGGPTRPDSTEYTGSSWASRFAYMSTNQGDPTTGLTFEAQRHHSSNPIPSPLKRAGDDADLP